MATLTIKNVPPELHRKLRKRAKLYHRSMNSQVIDVLRLSLAEEPVDPEKFLAEVREARERTARETGIFLTDEDIRAAKNWGRM